MSPGHTDRRLHQLALTPDVRHVAAVVASSAAMCTYKAAERSFVLLSFVGQVDLSDI